MGRPGSTYHGRQITSHLLGYNFHKSQELLFLFLFASIILSLNSFSFAESQLVDRIEAEVNSIPILYSEIQEKIKEGPLVMVSPFPALSTDPSYNQALEDAINFQLIRDHAERVDPPIEVLDDEVDSHIDRMIKSNNATLDQLKAFIEAQGKNFESYKNDIRDQILFMKFRGRVIMPLVKISNKDILQDAKLSGTDLSHSYIYKLRKILINIPKELSPALKTERLKQIQDAHKKLSSGMDFVTAQKLYSEIAESDSPSWEVKLDDLDPQIRDAIAALNPSEFTAPIAIDTSHLIFLVEDKALENTKEDEQATRIRNNRIRSRKMNDELARWLKEERMKSKIRILHKES